MNRIRSRAAEGPSGRAVSSWRVLCSRRASSAAVSGTTPAGTRDGVTIMFSKQTTLRRKQNEWTYRQEDAR